MPSKDPLTTKGRRIREEVLGAEYVKSRAQAADEYTEGFNEFTTKAAWALIWSRPGLTRKQRSLVTLGALTALHQQTELRLHIRAALRNGLTRKEVAEALILAEGPDTVGAFIAEPVLGTGGITPPPAGYWPPITPACSSPPLS